MSGFPKDAKKTGKKFSGVEVISSETVPNCGRCFVIAGQHKKTGETGWYASCKKTGVLEHFGPYKSIYEVLRVLILARECDSCQFNKSDNKESFLQEMDEKIEEEMREKLGEDHILIKIDDLYQKLVEYRMDLDVNFKNKFGMRLFFILPDNSVAVLNFCKPCENMVDFSTKVSILMGLIDRINPEVKTIIKSPDKENYQRSIQIIEQILKENKRDYEKSIISNFRNLNNLRGKLYPVHATGSEVITILNNFGIGKFPPENWEAAFTHIFKIILTSVKNLNDEIQAI